jgi:hypothetical protein
MNDRWCKIILILATLVGVERFCHYQTDGFQLYKILSDLPPRPEWETAPLDPKELRQPYYYLGSGGQCYAFISQDGNSVLKFFKHHHMRPKSWLNTFSFVGGVRHILHERALRMAHIFGSCKISYDDFRDETGLLYLHINKTTHLNRSLRLIDRLGIAHTIDLDTTSFVLQKTAELAYPAFDRVMAQGDLEGAKRRIDSLIALILARSHKGISDRDPIIRRNFGFIGERAIEIDLGSFTKDPFLRTPSAAKKVLFYETLKFKKWLAKHHPSLLPYFQERLVDEISSEC